MKAKLRLPPLPQSRSWTKNEMALLKFWRDDSIRIATNTLAKDLEDHQTQLTSVERDRVSLSAISVNWQMAAMRASEWIAGDNGSVGFYTKSPTDWIKWFQQTDMERWWGSFCRGGAIGVILTSTAFLTLIWYRVIPL